jgi:hypothetical protein
LLCRTPIALPVIYILAGTREGEGCVIERTEHDHAVRPIAHDRICAGNHFETRPHGIGLGWRARPIDSVGRARKAHALPLATINDRFDWFQAPIANPHTRVVMLARADSGCLSVFGARGDHGVTEVFQLIPVTDSATG